MFDILNGLCYNLRCDFLIILTMRIYTITPCISYKSWNIIKISVTEIGMYIFQRNFWHGSDRFTYCNSFALFINKSRSEVIVQGITMFVRCCKKLVNVVAFALDDICTTGKTSSAFHIRSFQHLKFVAVTMATSSATEHRCRRLDGKVAVVTASTAGCVYVDLRA